jgi:multidrug resistance efflux pump
MIRAPFSGRISAANVKVGNFVRPADTAPLAVINQMAPVYVSFAVPQACWSTSKVDGEGDSVAPRRSRHQRLRPASRDGRKHCRCDHGMVTGAAS